MDQAVRLNTVITIIIRVETGAAKLIDAFRCNSEKSDETHSMYILAVIT